MNTPIEIYEAYSYDRRGKAKFDGYTWSIPGSPVSHGPFRTREAAQADADKKAGKQ